MQLDELIQKHLNTFKEVCKEGKRNKDKFGLIFLVLILFKLGETLYHSETDDLYYIDIFGHIIKFQPFVFVLLVVLGFWFLISYVIAPAKATSFVSKKKIKAYNSDFKNDLGEYICKLIPEIKSYTHYKKVLPYEVYQSGLFDLKSAQFYGDELMEGEYKDIIIEMSEMKILKFPKIIFRGWFVHCTFIHHFNNEVLTQIVDQQETILQSIESKYQTKVQLSSVENEVYIAIPYKFELFEWNNKKSLNDLEVQIQLLQDVVTLVKELTDLNQKVGQTLHPDSSTDKSEKDINDVWAAFYASNSKEKLT